MRKASRQYAKTLRNLKGQPIEAEALARPTLQFYKGLAVETGESYYIGRYNNVLDQDQGESKEDH